MKDRGLCAIFRWTPLWLCARMDRFVGRVPRWMGIAWYELAYDRVVVMVMPLHLIAGLTRRAWHHFRYPRWIGEDAVRQSFERGHKVGWHRGYEVGHRAGIEAERQAINAAINHVCGVEPRR